MGKSKRVINGNVDKYLKFGEIVAKNTNLEHKGINIMTYLFHHRGHREHREKREDSYSVVSVVSVVINKNDQLYACAFRQ